MVGVINNSYLAGQNLSKLPVEPKLGKMLILGAMFQCLDPIMTVVAGLSVRDPFLTPFDKKDVSCYLLPMVFGWEITFSFSMQNFTGP